MRIKMKKKWLTIVATISIAIIVLCYWPFVQLKEIDAEDYLRSHIDNSLDGKIRELLTRLELYKSCWFIHKGDIYSDIPFLFLRNDTIHTQKMDIKFNWDNSVTINDGIKKIDLHVNRICIEPMLYPFSVHDYPLKLHETRDSLFVGIFMYDDKNNEIDVYRQKNTLPLGGRRVGFRFNIDGKVFVTGAKERFHY